MDNPEEFDSYDFPENDDDYDDDDDTGDDYWQYGYCGFCGEELSTSDSGGEKCRNCGYDEDYERGKIGRSSED